MKPSGDHQVDHKPEVIVESDRDAFADAAQFPYRAACGARQRRLGGAQEKRARPNADPFERLPYDARFERGEVRGNVGQLRHTTLLAVSGH